MLAEEAVGQRGDLNLSDMFTKCVGQALFQRFREAMGFATHDLSLSVLVTKKSQGRLVNCLRIWRENQSEACPS